MFGFSDYFDKEKENIGFEDGREEIKTHLLLLDLLLEHYLDEKTNSSEGLIFSRGMKMTEAEVESYYMTPPADRKSTGYTEAFAGDVNEAFTFIEKRTKATAPEVFLPVREMELRLDLDRDESLAAVLSFAGEYDLKYTRIFGYIAAEPSMQYPTLGVYRALYETFAPERADEVTARIFGSGSRLLKLVFDREALSEKKRPYLHTPLVLQQDLRDFLYEGDGCDKEKEVYLPASYVEKTKELLKAETSEGRFFYLECEDASDAETVLSYLEKGRDLCLIRDKEDVRGQLLRSLLYRRRLLVRSRDSEAIKEILEETGEADKVWIFGSEEMPKALLQETAGRLVIPFTLSLPTPQERFSIWKHYVEAEGLTIGEDVSLEDIADTFDFSLTKIREIIGQLKLKAVTEATGTVSRHMIRQVLFRYNEAQFNGLATRVHTAYTWDDIEIDAAQKQKLTIACDRYRLRGRIDAKYKVAANNAYGNGVSVLLYGSPGTGKTMASQVVANELGLPLYRVDVSQIFSKYIGETQKNLGKIFDEAKKANVILFFDEADALFSKRTDVGDSNDRYANAETAYLLQKIEEHNGMTILATNLYHNFDSAFVRRITYTVRLDSPDEATRLRLWQHTLPESMPVAPDVDFEFLAESFELSGSNIKAILHTAAYMAGAKDATVTMRDLVMALKMELEKLGRIIDATDFANYGVYL